MEIRIESGEAFAVDTLVIGTDSLPDQFPEIEIVTADRSRMENGWTLSSLSLGDAGVFRSFPMMFDANGDVRWYLDLSSFDDIVFMVERFANGNLLFGHRDAIFEFDMLGTEISKWSMPGYFFHHDVVEKPDGNLLVAVDKGGIGTVEDHVIELDRSSGAIVNEWDLREILDMYRGDVNDDDTDWFHMNSVWYSEADDVLILSGRNQGVVKVTRDNELVWILAPHRGWGRAGVDSAGHETADFLLTAVDSTGTPYPAAVQDGGTAAPDFDWPWTQHAAMILPNGNLFLFDNGARRRFSNEGPDYSRGVEYAIDESSGTVRQVWQYGAERGEPYFSGIISDVDLMADTENRLIMPGIVKVPDSRAYVTEVSYPDGTVIFEAAIKFRNQFGSGSMEWGQFDLVYRSERLRPFPE